MVKNLKNIWVLQICALSVSLFNSSIYAQSNAHIENYRVTQIIEGLNPKKYQPSIPGGHNEVKSKNDEINQVLDAYMIHGPQMVATNFTALINTKKEVSSFKGCLLDVAEKSHDDGSRRLCVTDKKMYIVVKDLLPGHIDVDKLRNLMIWDATHANSNASFVSFKNFKLDTPNSCQTTPIPNQNESDNQRLKYFRGLLTNSNRRAPAYQVQCLDSYCNLTHTVFGDKIKSSSSKGEIASFHTVLMNTDSIQATCGEKNKVKNSFDAGLSSTVVADRKDGTIMIYQTGEACISEETAEYAKIKAKLLDNKNYLSEILCSDGDTKTAVMLKVLKANPFDQNPNYPTHPLILAKIPGAALN